MGDRTRLILVLMLTLIAISIANGAKLSREVPASEVLAKIKTGQPVEFDNCTIVGYLNLSTLKIDEQVHFNNTFFRDSVNFETTTFNRAAYFIGATFEGFEIPYKSSTVFKMEMDYMFGMRGFSNYSFSRDVYVSGYTVFLGATFSGDAWFNGATFNRDAVFSETTFSGNAWFNGATFSRNAYFGGTKFSRGAIFSGGPFFSFGGARTIFSGDALFRRATFNEYALFSKVTFSGDAWFEEVTFSGKTDFSDDKFGNYAYFSGATFIGEVQFDRATFGECAWFGEDVSLKGAIFSGFFLGWDDIKESIKSDEATYLGLVKNFKNQGQFYEADDCWFQYRSQYMKAPSDYLALVTCGFGVKWLQTIYFGIFMILSFGLLYYRIITTRSNFSETATAYHQKPPLQWAQSDTRSNFSETAAAYPRSKLRSIMFKNKEIFTGQLLDSIWFSTVVLLSVPSELYPNKADTYKKYAKEIKYHWPILERLIGLGIWLLFINTLSRTILHL